MPYRGLCACYEVCPVRDCSAPVVPRQEEFSGAATVFDVLVQSVLAVIGSLGDR